MNKSEFVVSVAEKSGLDKKQAAAAVDAFIETVKDSVKNGEKVSFIGFGSFDLKERPEREGKNPRTGELMKIAASKVPVFKVGKGFKDFVN